MGIVVHMAVVFLVPEADTTLPELMGGVVGSIIIGIFVYGAASYVIKSPELSRVLMEASKGIGKKWPKHKAF